MVTTIGTNRVYSIQLFSGCPRDADAGLALSAENGQKPRTTQSDPTHRVVGNQLDRCFRTEAPNQVWVSDLTYLKVAGQWRYLVIFLDLFSRKAVRWDLSDSLEASGTVRALQ